MMLSDITIGEYYPGNSILHQMDPRMKILLLFFFMIALFVFHSFVSYAALTVCSLACSHQDGLKIRTAALMDHSLHLLHSSPINTR